VHVCRTLQILREQKIVRLANHRLEIIDPRALIAAAEIEHDMLDHQQRGPAATQTASSPLNPDATGSLPAGWMPVQEDHRVRAGFSSSRTHEFAAAKAA
jgi:hypothetical protein